MQDITERKRAEEQARVLSAISARTMSLPIVVATGTGDEELVVRVLRLGASD